MERLRGADVNLPMSPGMTHPLGRKRALWMTVSNTAERLSMARSDDSLIDLTIRSFLVDCRL